MNPPLVSICTPTYNRPDYLQRTVASCLAQTYGHWEMIITDNSTNDDTARLAATWTDPRIRYYKNPVFTQPGHPAIHSSNRAVAMAQGKYVQFLMDDDLIKPRFLELMVAVLEQHPSVGMVAAPIALIDEQDRRICPKLYLIRTMQYRYRYQVGDGTPYRSYLYAADLAIWLWTILVRGASNRPYNVGSRHELSIQELAQTVSRALPGQVEVRIAQKPVAGQAAARYVPETARAEQELGLRVWTPLEEAIRRTAQWHQRIK